MLKTYISYIKESAGKLEEAKMMDDEEIYDIVDHEFEVGDIVVHRIKTKFGQGVIIDKTPTTSGEKAKYNYTVEFENETDQLGTVNVYEPAKPGHGWRTRARFLKLVEKGKPLRQPRLRWYRNGKLDESIKDNIEVGDIVRHPDRPEFGLGVVMLVLGKGGQLVIEFENPTGVHADRKPAKDGHGWITSVYDIILVKKLKGTKEIEQKRQPRMRWYRHGKLED